MKFACLISLALTFLPSPQNAFAESDALVVGNDFVVPATQQIQFVPLKKIDPRLYDDPLIPRSVDLQKVQSKVAHQGMRGACTYFVVTSLVESLIKQKTGQEVDLSEEYMAWAAKTKLQMRSLEEGSSVAVDALALQRYGFMFEQDLPYQPSWFDEGQPCENLKNAKDISPICYSHSGPNTEQSKKIRPGSPFKFYDIGSSSLEIVREIAKRNSPVTISILAHPKMWDATKTSGDLYLDPQLKDECILNPKSCSGHAALIVGYDLDSRLFMLKNSWGEQWGNKGYGTIPFDYIDQMSDRRLLTGDVVAPLNL